MNKKCTYKGFLDQIRPGQIWPHFFVIVGCVLMATVVVVNYTLSVAGDHAMQTVRANNERIDRFDELLLLLVDAETSVRGYLLTHSSAYLELFKSNEGRLEPLLNELAEDFPPTDPHRQDFEALRDYAVFKRDYLAQAAAAGKVLQSIGSGESGTGKIAMDQIRDDINKLKRLRIADNDRLEMEAAVRLRNMQWAMYLLALGSFVLIVALFVVQQRQARLRVYMNNLLEDENVRLESMVAQRTSELNDLASYLTNAREAERSRLARELHDELGSLLTAAKMDASWLLRSLGASADAGIRDRFRRLIDSIGAGIRLKRNIIDDLHPALLQGLGLIEALRGLAQSFSDDIAVELHLPADDPDLVEAQSLALYRIAQESLTNIRKYAKARHVQLGLALVDQRIVLWVEDDGVGFDPETTSLKRHGLAGMKHRVLMFGGVFTLRAAPGKGARVEARMPLQVATKSDRTASLA